MLDLEIEVVFSLHLFLTFLILKVFYILLVKLVEIFLEQREVAFLSPRKICENLNFSREVQIFANSAG